MVVTEETTGQKYNVQFMAALRSRCGHYIRALWFLLLYFLPLEWMLTILLHMVWP